MESKKAMAFLGLFSGKRPANLGVRNGQLAACPASPNCVSSQAGDVTHHVDPFDTGTAPGEAFARLRGIVAEMPGAAIVTETESYLHAEFTSSFFGFVDDLELQLDETARIVHVRSASRLGYSDLGANRKRVEEIRRRFAASSRPA